PRAVVEVGTRRTFVRGVEANRAQHPRKLWIEIELVELVAVAPPGIEQAVEIESHDGSLAGRRRPEQFPRPPKLSSQREARTANWGWRLRPRAPRIFPA